MIQFVIAAYLHHSPAESETDPHQSLHDSAADTAAVLVSDIVSALAADIAAVPAADTAAVPAADTVAAPAADTAVVPAADTAAAPAADTAVVPVADTAVVPVHGIAAAPSSAHSPLKQAPHFYDSSAIQAILKHKRNFVEKIGEKIYNKFGDNSNEVSEEYYKKPKKSDFI